LRFAQTPYGSRVQIVEGDFFQDPIPKGHDAILIANIIHCFPAESCPRTPQPCSERRICCSPTTLGGFLDYTEPVFAALMAGEFLLTPGRGDVYSLDDASAWFQRTGWRPIDHKPLARAGEFACSRSSLGPTYEIRFGDHASLLSVADEVIE